MIEIKLLPCPFCGEPAELDRSRGFRAMNGKLGNAVAIYCRGCHADMAICEEDVKPVTNEDIVEMLSEAWNKRARSRSELTDEIEALKRRLANMLDAADVLKNREIGLNARIAAMASMLDRVPHEMDLNRAGDFPPGQEPCDPLCVRCAWEAMKH